jgi:hypothetical protein
MSFKGFRGQVGSMVAMMGAGFALFCVLPALLVGGFGAAWLGSAIGLGAWTAVGLAVVAGVGVLVWRHRRSSSAAPVEQTPPARSYETIR